MSEVTTPDCQAAGFESSFFHRIQRGGRANKKLSIKQFCDGEDESVQLQRNPRIMAIYVLHSVQLIIPYLVARWQGLTLCRALLADPVNAVVLGDL